MCPTCQGHGSILRLLGLFHPRKFRPLYTKRGFGAPTKADERYTSLEYFPSNGSMSFPSFVAQIQLRQISLLEWQVLPVPWF